MKILVAEDDRLTRQGLIDIFQDEGYETVAAANGKEALARFAEAVPDVVCLDIMMPDISGYDVCREIRRTHDAVPILFISAKSEEIDKVLGLEMGADDYIVKPFGVKEVIARIRAVTRRHARTQKFGEEPFTIGDLEVLPDELRALRDDDVIELSVRDVSILKLLAGNRGKVLDRDTIFNTCWGLDYMPNSRTLDQHISQLRKRIELDPKHPAIITTVHNAGYRYE
ncbi:MAG: response regulator transcription factor [Verrucomicrobia bacterium]|jgi:DNA-binding response OmpR family regulator|nr:response regulator transcription factor [Verrucomicrobiota bacterium]